MNYIISANGQQGILTSLPIDLFFWGFVIAYCIHILEESLMCEVFVDKVKNKYWSEYSWRKFFCFNTMLLSINIIAIILYECLGSALIILPLSLAFERVINGFYHLGETLVTKKFSSGLISSIIFWILWYLIIKYSFLNGKISASCLYTSMLIGLIVELIMFGSMYIASKKTNKNQ